jgi:hypothetical protein
MRLEKLHLVDRSILSPPEPKANILQNYRNAWRITHRRISHRRRSLMTPHTQKVPRMTIRMQECLLDKTPAMKGDSNAFQHMKQVPETTIKMHKDSSYVIPAIQDDMKICYIMSSGRYPSLRLRNKAYCITIKRHNDVPTEVSSIENNLEWLLVPEQMSATTIKMHKDILDQTSRICYCIQYHHDGSNIGRLR